MGVKGWTVVFTGERWKADLIGAALVADGLLAEVFEDQPYGSIIEARVMVPDGQVSSARRLIDQAENAPVEAEEESEEGV